MALAHTNDLQLTGFLDGKPEFVNWGGSREVAKLSVRQTPAHGLDCDNPTECNEYHLFEQNLSVLVWIGKSDPRKPTTDNALLREKLLKCRGNEFVRVFGKVQPSDDRMSVRIISENVMVTPALTAN